MTNLRRPLRLNVGFLISGPIGSNRDFEFDYETMRLGDDLTVREFVGTARFSRTPQGLLLQGDFQAQTELECVRCLEMFTQPLKWSFTDLYAFNRRNMTDSGLMVPEDGQIDLEPLLREYALLEFPISPVCKPDCKGLCPICGENLNVTDCGHRPAVDSPFAALKDLLK
ncbi:MAG TPA: YceD family protein [Anaerolineales bacterium]|nr:YceD family protein [Anaerolineales bacterium]